MFGQLNSPQPAQASFCWLRMDCGGESAEVPHQPVDVRLVVLDGDQPLLDLAPGRQEDPAVVLEQPVRVAERVIGGEEAAVVGDGLVREDDAAFRADGYHAPVQS